MNIQEEVSKIHAKFGTTEMANYKIQLLFDKHLAQSQAERMYSEEDLLSAFKAGMMFIGEDKGSFKEWFEQFKKK
jgi:hypothetical protein